MYRNNPDNALGKMVYTRHLQGMDDDSIAQEFDMSVDTIITVRKNYYETSVRADVDNDEARTKWRERIEVWISRLDLAYDGGRIPIDKAITGFQKLASLGVDLDGLNAAKKLDITSRGSKVDQAIESLLGEFKVDDEEDAPL